MFKMIVISAGIIFTVGFLTSVAAGIYHEFINPNTDTEGVLEVYLTSLIGIVCCINYFKPNHLKQ
jgi:hypothetical protein